MPAASASSFAQVILPTGGGGALPPAAPAPTQTLAPTINSPHPSIAQLATALRLDVGGGDAWLDTLSRDIAAIARQPHGGTLQFRLDPGTLGAMRVELTHGTDGARLAFHVATEAAHSAISEGQARLLGDARLHGARIVDSRVTIDAGAGQSGLAGGGGWGSGLRDAFVPPPPPLRHSGTDIAVLEAEAADVGNPSGGAIDRFA